MWGVSSNDIDVRERFPEQSASDSVGVELGVIRVMIFNGGSGHILAHHSPFDKRIQQSQISLDIILPDSFSYFFIH